MTKKTKQQRAPGGGRKAAYGEPTVALSVRLPQSVVDLLDGLGPSRNAALVAIVTGSVQYRLQYGGGSDSEG